MAEFWHFFVLVLSIAVLVLVENRKRGHCALSDKQNVPFFVPPFFVPLTLGGHHAQLRQVAPVLNSEQPHLDQNNVRLTMDCNDRIGMWQKGHTAQG